MNTLPLARISFDDDDRPSGLKLDRTGYTRKGSIGGSAHHTSPVSRFAKPPAWDPIPRSSFESETTVDRYGLSRALPTASTSSGSNHSSDYSGGGPYARASNNRSPSIPARSPHRIRDSQQSTVSSHRPTPSSMSVKSPVMEQHHPVDNNPIPQQTRNNARLSVQVAQLWKNKPVAIKETINEDDTRNEDPMEGLLKQVLVSQALVDAQEYNMLSFEQVERLRKRQTILQDQIAHMRTSLAVAKRVANATHSLLHLEAVKDPRGHHDQSKTYKEAVEATRRTESIAAELISLVEEEAEIHRQIMQHTASALRLEASKPSPSPQQHQPATSMLSPPMSSTSSSPPPSSTMLVDEHSRQELEQLTTALDAFVRRHQLVTGSEPAYLQRSDSGYGSHSEWSTLLASMETEFSSYKAKVERLERQLESSEEKLRLEAASTKKYEVQLRMAQDKREAAEARCKELEESRQQSSIDFLGNMSSSSSSSQDKERISQLEEELHEARSREDELQKRVSTMQGTLADLEVRCTKAESEAGALESRERAASEALTQCQSDLSALRAEKQRWERALKRESVMQLMEGGSESYRAKYEQQVEEQRQEYEAQLQEQHALLDKTTRVKEQLEADYEKMTSVCKDLEDLIRDKNRTVDARDLRINQLEQDIAELRSHQQQARNGGGGGNIQKIEELQRAFTAREQAWLAQSASMETDFEGIMKEFDRLTTTAMEFETDRMKYEQRIEELTRRMQQLEAELTEERISKLGLDTSEGPTTASLRKEFRKLVSDLKADHQRILDRETSERKSVESKLRDMKHEREMARYERVNKGVQTHFIADI